MIGKEVDFPRNIGAIIEAPGFLPTVSAYKNLEYLASLKGVIGKNEIRKAISLVGLDPDDKKHVGKYSLGMKQRLGLAQAIMENPDILILDEPMNGLDNTGVSEMRELLLQFKADGKTIIIVSTIPRTSVCCVIRYMKWIEESWQSKSEQSIENKSLFDC